MVYLDMQQEARVSEHWVYRIAPPVYMVRRMLPILLQPVMMVQPSTDLLLKPEQECMEEVSWAMQPNLKILMLRIPATYWLLLPIIRDSCLLRFMVSVEQMVSVILPRREFGVKRIMEQVSLVQQTQATVWWELQTPV